MRIERCVVCAVMQRWMRAMKDAKHSSAPRVMMRLSELIEKNLSVPV